ncbi:class I SAM-dependent DNA methyltransferase [Candidatus Cryosericum septentrionale]|jgi:SAM-dependent methyltransferase|uniref:Class I SAM-dependent methyltransferase n=1 Tax=Candidatus Cryosericum septentrionale TaxID=2290913 RepID=A0A398E485_9BACT|nr:class I SAM-dependent methyltransferase [Candidatus Cryosericum septentrionale]RIE17431.1 class I SAM-dependent methyltransferase [Candidatus Cryosericum septentrionale]
MMITDWTQEYFDDTYRRLFLDTVEPARTRYQVQQLLRLCAVLPGAAVLDVGCGVGRHSIELARLGFRVTGVDMNADYIAACRERTAQLGLKAEFYAMDSRVMKLHVRADLSISLWSSFGYYGEIGDLQILQRVSEHTRRGGHVVVDVENRDYIVKHFVPEEWHENEQGLVCEKRRFDAVDGTVSTRRVVLSGGERCEYRRVLRMYTVAELAALFEAAGLRPERWCGDYDGSRFGPESKRMIAIAER